MRVVFISVGDSNNDGLGGFLDEASALYNKIFPPNVLTTSYGFNEDEVPFLLAVFVVLPFHTL